MAVINCPFCGHELPEMPEGWEGVEDLIPLLAELEAGDLLDPAYWRRIDALTKGTEVYYDKSLRTYLAWWEGKPPHRRHHNRKRGFVNWIKEDIAREQWRKKRAKNDRKGRST